MKRNREYIGRYLTGLLIILLILLPMDAFGENKAMPWLLLLFDDEKPLETTREIGPEGGTFKFPNGVTLDIPAGAVTEITAITVKDVPCDDVNPILSARQYASHEKRCLGGFSAEPAGLAFNVPIKATVPVLPLEPGEIPVQIEGDLNEQKYWIAEADLVYRGEEGIVEMNIPHFSNMWLAALYEHLDEVCKKCDTWEALPVECENLDPLQPRCCLLLQFERENCARNCYCCREIEMIVKVTEVDFSTGDCQILGGDVEVTFPHCLNSPTEKHSVSETSADCPEDMAFEIEIQPPSMELYVCEETQFTATITGKSADDEVLIIAAEFNPQWNSINPQVADFIDQDGTLRGFLEGPTTVQALVSKNSPIPPGEATVTVTSNISSFKVTPLQAKIQVGGKIVLNATILDVQGDPLDASTVTWSSSGKTIADVTRGTGQSTSVVGKRSGRVTITATYEYECEKMEAKAVIIVEEAPDIDLTGTWKELVLLGGSDCYYLGEEHSDEWVREDYVFELSVTQHGTRLSAYYTDFPQSAPYTGTIAATGNEAEPYNFDFSVSSSNTVDCIKFFESGGSDLVFGSPICATGWKCEPLTCYEEENVAGKVLAGGNSFLAHSSWQFSATLDIEIIDSDEIFEGVSVQCEGGAYSGGCKRGFPVVEWITGVCLDGEPAKLLCESTHGNSPDKRLIVGSCTDVPGSSGDDGVAVACVYCAYGGGQ